jgi:hypothetical protein
MAVSECRVSWKRRIEPASRPLLRDLGCQRRREVVFVGRTAPRKTRGNRYPRFARSLPLGCRTDVLLVHRMNGALLPSTAPIAAHFPAGMEDSGEVAREDRAFSFAVHGLVHGEGMRHRTGPAPRRETSTGDCRADETESVTRVVRREPSLRIEALLVRWTPSIRRVRIDGGAGSLPRSSGSSPD